jgi:hypothetical protein
MVRSIRIRIFLSVVSVAFMVFFYVAFSKYSSTICHGNFQFISRNEEDFNGEKRSHMYVSILSLIGTSTS